MPVPLRLGLAVLILAQLLSSGVRAGDALPALRNGDIVFQESGNRQSEAIALASGSRYTHTGIIEIDSRGEAFVVEASGPVRTTPLATWIASGVAGHVTVKRMTALSEANAKDVIAAAHRHDGKPYDVYFYKGKDAIYCSELVHIAFHDGAAVEIGREERIADLRLGSGAVQALIAARWRQHPACLAAQARSLDECMPHLLEETLVTPASVARDPKLVTVYSNFGANAE